MTRLVLVGAGGLAREVLSALTAGGGRRESVIVVDDDTSRWGADLGGAPVVGGLDLLPEYADRRVVVCAGRGVVRRAVVSRLARFGVGHDRFAAVVDPRAVVPEGCEVGGGSIVLANVVLTADVRLGRHVVVMPGATVTHDDVLEDYATVCAGVSLGGTVTVREAAYLGMNSSVREGTTVGKEAVLGMGAALLDDLPDSETWVGVPARPMVRRAEVEAWSAPADSSPNEGEGVRTP